MDPEDNIQNSKNLKNHIFTNASICRGKAYKLILNKETDHVSE
jgi:hypothetical protein